MSCPTCGHTMQRVFEEAVRVYWCPRCGTIQTHHPTGAESEAPKLVGRCRKFENLQLGPADLPRQEDLRSEWFVTGIAESIHLPEERAG